MPKPTLKLTKYPDGHGRLMLHSNETPESRRLICFVQEEDYELFEQMMKAYGDSSEEPQPPLDLKYCCSRCQNNIPMSFKAIHNPYHKVACPYFSSSLT